MKKTLYLIRGLAGSGKTTLARTILDSYMSWDEDVDGLMVCADDFFEVDGEYRFDASRLSQAHEWCRGRVEDNMLDGEHIIVTQHLLAPLGDGAVLQARQAVPLQRVRDRVPERFRRCSRRTRRGARANGEPMSQPT